MSKKNKFKVGDKVRVVNATSSFDSQLGKTGFIIDIKNNFYPYKISGVSGLWMDEELELLQPKESISEMKNSKDYKTHGSAEFKDTNPKDSVDIKKVPMSVVSSPVLQEMALGMLEGALKYGRHNYRVVGVRASVYYDATMRHLMAWWEGQDIDPDSGLNHISKAMASLCVLRDAMLQDKLNDDRPPKTLNQEFVKDNNKKVEELLNKYPEPVSPYIEADKNVNK